MAKKQKQLWKRRLKRITRRIHLLLVPHSHNHYRPHIIRRYGLLTVVGLAIGLQFGYNYTESGSVLGRVTTITPQALLASTNDERTAHGVGALQINPQLSQAAAAKAEDMISRGYWSHVSPTGTQPWAWIDEAGYSYQKAGENLAKNFATASGVVAAWMDSYSHRENLLNPDYRDVGFAAVSGEMDGKPTTVVVAFYGLPVRGLVAGSQASQVELKEAIPGKQLTLAARIGIALQSLTPAAVTSLALIFVATTVAVTAHFYRSQLPPQRRKTAYKHHGAVKASGLMAVAAFMVLLYGGGQI